jgi:hypothetical protein
VTKVIGQISIINLALQLQQTQTRQRRDSTTACALF